MKFITILAALFALSGLLTFLGGVKKRRPVLIGLGTFNFIFGFVVLVFICCVLLRSSKNERNSYRSNPPTISNIVRAKFGELKDELYSFRSFGESKRTPLFALHILPAE